MLPEDLISHLPMIPYLEHGKDLKGMDCFGLIEYWHKRILGIEITDRTEQPSEPQGFLEGYQSQNDWIAVAEPENHCVAVMKAFWGGEVLEHGHCGMVWQGRVYHFKPEHGFQHSSIDDRQLRITKYMKHRQCNQS